MLKALSHFPASPLLRKLRRDIIIKPVSRCSTTTSSTLTSTPPTPISSPDFNFNSNSNSITVNGVSYPRDSWTNLSTHIADLLPRKLHLQPDHPLSLTRSLIERRFPAPIYTNHSSLSPIVSVHQNFDSLGFPPDHVGRSKTDTYYVNASTVLRTHTSAHQADMFRSCASPGFTITADVYRRDAIDRSHYPVFHQMEGARMWSRADSGGDITDVVLADLTAMPKHDLVVEDLARSVFHGGNPLQPEHTARECEAVAAHLKRTLEGVVVEVFGTARAAVRRTAGASADGEALHVRWVEAYFPFTSPSWELEVWWQGAWLELLGCGVVRQSLPTGAGTPDKVGWAFGLGLERVAMLLFRIPDIRLFWSKDKRFLGQFREGGEVGRFQPFSKHPPCHKDVAFWLKSVTNSVGGVVQSLHENDVMEVVRSVAGDRVEDVSLVDEFLHPKTGRKSLCWRINYRDLERTLTNEETNEMHEKVRSLLVERYGVELR